jgi:hypothetical protein
VKSLYENHTSGEAANEISGYGTLQDLLNTTGELMVARVPVVRLDKDIIDNTKPWPVSAYYSTMSF